MISKKMPMAGAGVVTQPEVQEEEALAAQALALTAAKMAPAMAEMGLDRMVARTVLVVPMEQQTPGWEVMQMAAMATIWPLQIQTVTA